MFIILVFYEKSVVIDNISILKLEKHFVLALALSVCFSQSVTHDIRAGALRFSVRIG